MLNIVALNGRLTAVPELRTTTSGKSVCSFCIAVDRSYTKQGEERKADFINIVTWQGTAEFVCRYFGKGDMIAINGQLQTRHYEDKDCNKRTAVEVLAREVNFCGSKNKGNNGNCYDEQVPHPSDDDFEEVGADDNLPF